MDPASEAPGDRPNALQRASTGAPDRSLEDRVRRLERESRNLKRMALLLPDRIEERSMHCQVCRHESPPESRYCLECGAALSGVCRDCGIKLPHTAKYCNRCGTSTAARAKEPADARPSGATARAALAPEDDAADADASSRAHQAEELATQPLPQLAPLASEAEAPTTQPPAYERLLGSLLSGGAGFPAGPPWLSELLRHRAESVHVEFRSLPGAFEIVENEGEPGLMSESGQLWLGHSLVIAAPETALAGVIEPTAWPDFLDASRTARCRLAVRLRCKTAALPEGMGRRLVVTEDPKSSDGLGDVTVSLYASAEAVSSVEVVARAVMPGDPRRVADDDLLAFEDRVEARVRALIPFAEKKLTRRKLERPLWDDDDWLEDPPPGQGWPAEIELRVNARPPVYRLDRAGVAGLGLEGDLLLGWRGGDAIAAEL